VATSARGFYVFVSIRMGLYLTEYDEVTKEYADRPDPKNYDWTLFRGYVFKDLFLHPNNPF
jgi:hypothetical protein